MGERPDARIAWLSRERRSLLAAIAIACVLVLLRSAIYLLYEQSFFDSDQAIIALMAKHLSEGRAFPLFFYGQTYMLTVDAYFAVPFVAAMGPTVAAWHASLVVCNMIAAALLIVGLVRWGGLSPAAACVAVVFFTFAPPLTAASLIEIGANIDPFIYVIVLWMLRDRPLWFGMVLALGFLHREFTIYALPAVLLGDAIGGRLWHADRLRTWLLAAAVALATWQGVMALKPYADLMGPGTRGELLNGTSGSQVGNLRQRMSLQPLEYPERARLMFTQHLPRLFGFARVEHAIASQGRDSITWLLIGGLAALLSRAAVRAWRARLEVPSFGWYLVAVGLIAAFGYIATRPPDSVVDRYILLTMLLPVGIFAVSWAGERNRAWRGLGLVLVSIWGGSVSVDHLAHVRRYAVVGEPNDIRVLADELVARNIQVAEASYWRAYKVSYLTGERAVVASTDFMRIQEYRRRAVQMGDRLVRIQEEACEGGERVSIWYLCRADGGPPASP